MTLSVVDWTMALFFLAALILLARFQIRLTAVDPQSFRRIAIGLGLLNLVALARLYSRLGILQGVPFLSEPVFFQLILWVIIITGITFLVSGVAEWLPLARASRETHQCTIARLSLFRKIEQLGSIEPRPEPFFQAALSHIVDTHGFTCGVMYALSASGERLQFVGSVNCTGYDEHLANVSLQARGKEGAGTVSLAGLGMLCGLPVQLGRPTLLLPIEVQKRVRGCFLFWSQNTPTDETVLDLKLIGDIVARRILHRSRQIKIDFFESVEQLYLQLNDQLAAADSPVDGLNCLIRELRPLVPVDYATLLVPADTGHQVDRLSVGVNGHVLCERGVLPGPALSALRTDLLASGETVTVAGASLTEDLNLELPGSFQSIAIVGSSAGQLVLGTGRSHAYSPAVLRALDYIAPHVRMMLEKHCARRTTETLYQRLTVLSRLLTGDQTKVIDRVAAFLRESLRVDTVRISVMDGTELFLNSLGLASKAVPPTMAPALGSMILDLLPLHTRAVASGEMVVWEEAESHEDLSESEALAVGTGSIRSLLAVPVMQHDTRAQVIGVITLTSANQSAARLASESNRVLLQTTAALVSNVLQQVRATSRLDVHSETGWLDSETPTGRRSRIRSSLTGILGSVELMRTLRTPDAARVEKFLSIIDRSARKIDACMTSIVPTTAVSHSEEVDTEEEHATR